MLIQGLLRAAQTRPNGLSTHFEGRTRAWPQTVDRVARLAAALRRLGVAPGDRVAILALNSDRYLEHFYAVAWAGAVTVPINTRLAAPEIAYILSDSGAVVLLVDDAFVPMLDRLRDVLAPMRAIVHLGTAPPAGLAAYEALIAAETAAAQALRSGDDLAGIFYTGGTTGKAKGVMLSHANLVINAMNAAPSIGLEPTPMFLHAAPMFHLGDGAWTFAVTMLGGSHCFIPRFDAEACLRTIADHGVTDTMLVPTMIALMLNLPDVARYDTSRLRQIVFGAAPMPEAILRRALDLWPDTRFMTGWGMTELSPIGTVLPARYTAPEHIAGGRYRSCGQAALSATVLIVDENDREVPRGTVGELIVRSPTVMQGYWNNPEATAEALRGGWLHSGDAAWMDDEGFVFIVDRIKDMIITGGENVYPAETESAISTLAGVAECAVIGIPDDRWGEAVHAVVVPRPGCQLEPEQVIDHCRQRLARYKCPRSVEIRQDPLPLTGAGKIQKAQLRAPHWTGRSKGVN
ncbi:long-chain fatty acid--CoA ligase [Reyranella sp. CPCC 100927]|uniref:acyl-CoA synthetase n=1 Tax=Reyranella sp. CPCC 100927 TaxID=2599616 RepID=UPI0011B51E83|nr:long-chain fatty acid--CoA ligase [Reyranella sp. CPCC 100927]TWT08790.1 long-chain fatty acid--CoA ligase [Reyranella sp. CPCC 100927]